MADESPASNSELAEAVERERKRASVRSLDISFNELADMYSSNELHITPEYQRTFRWSLTKQSQFIESVILEMPLPPIYAVEVGEGRWELIDGLQRLSTYLHFRGELDLPHRDPPIRSGSSHLKLEGCDIIPELNGMVFGSLNTGLQHRVRRTPLRVEVVRRESNPRFAYYMFIRLNQGGEALSDMEARNCAIRLLSNRFSNFLAEMAQVKDFQKCTADITDEFKSRMGLEELALRYFAFRPRDNAFVHDIEPFLTTFMRRVTDDQSADHIVFDYEAEEKRFLRTFDLILRAIGSDAFRRPVASGETFAGGFHMGHYEAFAVGVGRAIDDVPDPVTDDVVERVGFAIRSAKNDPEMRRHTVGGGKNFRRIYEAKFDLVADRVKEAL